MTDKQPKITSLNPLVLPDKRRVTMEMVVEDLPHPLGGSNVINFFDAPPAGPQPAQSEESPYPDIVLSILDDQRREVASLLIVEHKETYTSLTLHLRQPDGQARYTARAEMSHQGNTLQVVEVPFTLEQAAQQ